MLRPCLSVTLFWFMKISFPETSSVIQPYASFMQPAV